MEEREEVVVVEDKRSASLSVQKSYGQKLRKERKTLALFDVYTVYVLSREKNRARTHKYIHSMELTSYFSYFWSSEKTKEKKKRAEQESE